MRETASPTEGYDLTTYPTPLYALGRASRTYCTGTDVLAIEQMANYLILHYRARTEPGGWGMMYCRYVVNDQHWGTLRIVPYRPRTNFFDQGNFAGAQLRNKAIALYALMPLGDTYVISLKTVVAFPSATRSSASGSTTAGSARGAAAAAAAGEWLIVEDGAVCRLLSARADLPRAGSADPPERGPLGELWLTIYNYRGGPSGSGIIALGGAFWRGNLRAGFIVEVAERSDYASAADFLADLRRAVIEDNVDDAFIRTVVYRRGAMVQPQLRPVEHRAAAAAVQRGRL